MIEWLYEFDKPMVKQRRQVLPFMDNATCHSTSAKLKNVKLIFFPPNTTSLSQPLDQGIIQNFKIRYRRLVLAHILSEIEKISCAEELSKKITALDSIMWIKAAISQIKDSCVSNCFCKAGFPVPETVTEEENDRNVISDEELMQQLPPHLQTSDMNDYFLSLIHI